MDRPVLFCYDGSDGSKSALSVAVELVMHPADAVVLVVWTPVAIQLARGGSLMAVVPNEGEIDEEEIAAAQRLADEGAEGARGRGYNASARIARGERVGGQDDQRGRSRDRRPPDRLRTTRTRRVHQRPPGQRLAPTLRARRTAGADRAAAPRSLSGLAAGSGRRVGSRAITKIRRPASLRRATGSGGGRVLVAHGGWRRRRPQPRGGGHRRFRARAPP